LLLFEFQFLPMKRNKMETFPRNRNKKYTKRASCKIANVNSVIRKFCLRHRLSQVHFLVEKEDGSIRFCQKQINARWSVTHGNQLMLKNFSCKVHNDEPKSEKLAMGRRKNSQSEQDKSSLPTSGTEKQSTKPPPPPPGAIAAAAAAIAAAAATAAGDDLYTKTKIYDEVVKQLRDGASPSTVLQLSNEPQPLDLTKKTDKVRSYTYASTSSSSRANKNSVRQSRTTRKRKFTELSSTSSTHSSQPQIPLSYFFKMKPRTPEIPDSPRFSSPEATSNVENNATASILSNLLQKNTSPSSTMPATSKPSSSSISSKNDNYPPVNSQQVGNQRTDVSSAEQALVNNQQMPAASNPSSSIFSKNDNYPLVLKPHPIRFDAFQHPIPFSSAFASYIAVNLHLAMRMFVDALVQADNYITGHSGYSICHLCGEKFNIYLLFIYHTVVHCCEILKVEKYNFVIWNLFVADYVSVVKYSIPMPFEIMLSMEQTRGRQNPTSSDKQLSDPKRSQSGIENRCVTERDERFTSGTSESEQNTISPLPTSTNSNQQQHWQQTLHASLFILIAVQSLAAFQRSTVMESNYTANATSNYVNTGSVDGTNRRSDNGRVSQTDHQQTGFLPYCGERSIRLTQASEQLPPEQSNVNSNLAEIKQNSRKRRGRIPKAQLSKQQKSDQQIASSDQSKEAVTVQNCEENDAVAKNAHENLPNANSSKLAFHSNNTSPQTNYSNNQLNNSGITYPALTEPDASNKKRYSDVLANAYQLKAYYDALLQRSINDHLPSAFTRNQNCVLPVTPSMEYNYTANPMSNYANDGSNSGGFPRSDNLLPRFHPYSDDRSKRSKLLKSACPQKQMENQQSALSDQPQRKAVLVQNYEGNEAAVGNTQESSLNVDSPQLAFHFNKQMNNSGTIYPALTEPDASNIKHYSDALANAYRLKALYNAFPPPNFNEYLQRVLSCNQNCVLPVVTDPKVSISSNNLPVITSNANNSQSMPLASRACENTYSNNQKKSTETHWGMGLTTKDKAFSDTLKVEIPPPPSGLANYMSSQNTMNSSTIDLQPAQSRPSGANPLACNNNFVMPKLNNNFQPHGTSANPLNWERVFSGFPFFTCYVCNANFGDYYAFKMHSQLHSKPIQTDMISHFLGTSAMLQNSAFAPLGASSVALPRSNYPPYYKQSNIIGGHEQMPLGKPNYPLLNSEFYAALTNFQQGGGPGNFRYGNPPPVMAQVNFPNYGQNSIANQKGIYGQQPSVANDILNPQNANASSFPGLG
ncbi:hypothetical protein T03_9698, partial [Trichinella britovi]